MKRICDDIYNDTVVRFAAEIGDAARSEANAMPCTCDDNELLVSLQRSMVGSSAAKRRTPMPIQVNVYRAARFAVEVHNQKLCVEVKNVHVCPMSCEESFNILSCSFRCGARGP